MDCIKAKTLCSPSHLTKKIGWKSPNSLKKYTQKDRNIYKTFLELYKYFITWKRKPGKKTKCYVCRIETEYKFTVSLHFSHYYDSLKLDFFEGFHSLPIAKKVTIDTSTIISSSKTLSTSYKKQSSNERIYRRKCSLFLSKFSFVLASTNCSLFEITEVPVYLRRLFQN